MRFKIITRQALAETAADRFKHWAYRDDRYWGGWRKTGRNNDVDSEKVYNEFLAARHDPDKVDAIFAAYYPELSGCVGYTHVDCDVCNTPVELAAQYNNGEYDQHVCVRCAEAMIAGMKAEQLQEA